MNYKGQRFCRLKNGTIENLYYGDSEEPRNFYEEKGVWFLDHDIWGDSGVYFCHSEIMEFIDAEPIFKSKKNKRRNKMF